MWPEVVLNDMLKRALKRAEAHGLLNLGHFRYETLPEEVLKLRNLRGLSLGASVWDIVNGEVDRFYVHTEDNLSWERPIADLGPLARLSSLEFLDLSVCRAFHSLAPLTRLPKLKWLVLCGCKQLTDFTPLLAMTTLEELDVSKTQLHDYSLLSSLPRLRKLSIFGTNSAVDYGSLATLPHLEELYVVGEKAWQNLEFFSGLKKLRKLTMVRVKQVQDWTPVGRLPQLQSLTIQNCPTLTEFAPLARLLPQLKFLGIRQELCDLPLQAQSEPLYDDQMANCVDSVRAYFKDRVLNPRLVVPALNQELFDSLRAAIRDQLREWREDSSLPTVEQGLFGLGVFVMWCDDETLIFVYADTDESRAESQESLWEKEPSAERFGRWNTGDWSTLSISMERIAIDANSAIVNAYRLDTLSDRVACEARTELMTRSITATAFALKDLDAEGLFGAGETRQNVVLMVGELDHESGPEDLTMTAGIRFLNGDEVAANVLADIAQDYGSDYGDPWAQKILKDSRRIDLARRLVKEWSPANRENQDDFALLLLRSKGYETQVTDSQDGAKLSSCFTIRYDLVASRQLDLVNLTEPPPYLEGWWNCPVKRGPQSVLTATLRCHVTEGLVSRRLNDSHEIQT